MLKRRLIPVLLLKNGILVKSKNFNFHQSTGDPIGQVERFTDWQADELVYFDISRSGDHLAQSTIGSATSKKDILEEGANDFPSVISQVARKCTVPLTVGGGIRELSNISDFLKRGADKVSVNTKAIEEPAFIEEAAKKFGNQCVVVCVDVKLDPTSGKYEVYKNFGKAPTGLEPIAWCREAAERGAGEIILQSIDRDGSGKGYDLALLEAVSGAVDIPVIGLGGVGNFEHFAEGIRRGASAVAASNIFHFTELSVINAKKHMQSAGINVRI